MASLLLVDDDPVLRNLTAKLLRRAGHEVLEAGDGAECLALCAGQRFDLILIDVMLPETDGYALTRQLRAGQVPRGTRIVLITSHLAGPDPEKARAAGADAWTMKSIGGARLNDLVTGLLAQSPLATGDAGMEEV